MVLCAASRYKQKYYLAAEFEDLPDQIKAELQAACVLFTEEIGGVILLEFDDEGRLTISTQSKESDIMYDEIGARLKVKELQKDKLELFTQLELYYDIFFGENSSEKKAALLEKVKDIYDEPGEGMLESMEADEEEELFNESGSDYLTDAEIDELASEGYTEPGEDYEAEELADLLASLVIDEEGPDEEY